MSSKETFKKQFDNFKINSSETLSFRPNDAVVLYPALGNPAVVQQIEGTAYLELLVLCKSDDLLPGEAAFHLRMVPWELKDKPASYLTEDIYRRYLEDERAVILSEQYALTPDTFGHGLNGPDSIAKDKVPFLQTLGHMNVFPKVIGALSHYKHLYKIRIDLKNQPGGMYNIWWVNHDDYQRVRNRLYWWSFDQHMMDMSEGEYDMPLPFKKELLEYDEEVVDDPLNEHTNENIRASIYHPVYITDKKRLSLGHVTDIHLDSRMDLYAQSEASVIEVSENCSPTSDGDKRYIANPDFHIPIKERIANFNDIFTDISTKLLDQGADAIVITGDLVDYNRGIHTVQTHKSTFVPISEVWEALGSDVAEEQHYRDDRNWFLFYKKLIDLYDTKEKPVFTLLGNHDYVNYAMAPWPYWGIPWNGVFDQNLTLYESALCFGKGYKSSKGFRKDIREEPDFAEWYMIFINPFADFVVNYADQSLLMVDWAVKSNVIGPGAVSKLAPVIPGYEGPGGLHQARHLFKKKSDFDQTIRNNESPEPIVHNTEPYPIRNYSIYESWIKGPSAIKILCMHATGICPRDDISEGQVNHDLTWTDNRLCYGTFVSRRDQILKDVEQGRLSIILAGHSHRNLVMEVDGRHPGKTLILGAGETYGTVKRTARNIVMVTSSGGPLPKYLPGGPKICACPDKYAHGWDYEKKLVGRNRFYEHTDRGEKKDLTGKRTDKKTHICPVCQMPAKDMGDKKAKRHRPTGSLLAFDLGPEPDGIPRLTIESVPSTVKGCFPRKGSFNDENKIFTRGMRLEEIDNYKDYKDWEEMDPISIISRRAFTFYGYMDFPDTVQYVTFREQDGETVGLRGGTPRPVGKIVKDGNEVYFKQEVMKEDFKFLLWSASRKEDFAFVRYIYNGPPVERWDREILMAQLNDKVSNGYQEFDNSGQTTDKIQALVILFNRKPDLKKRKKICGY
jgi:hypothetical protein